MKKCKVLTHFSLLLITSLSFSQVQKTKNLHIGNTVTNNLSPSAALQIDDTTKGVLAPRMTQAQRTAIISPANGLLVYQTDLDNGFYNYDGTKWTRLLNADNAWSYKGNTIDNTAKLGTLNDQELKLFANGKEFAYLGRSAAATLSTALYVRDTISDDSKHSNSLKLDSWVTANGRTKDVRNFANYINTKDVSLGNSGFIAAINEIGYGSGTTGTSNGFATFAGNRVLNNASVTIPTAVGYATAITNDATTTSKIRNAIGLDIVAVQATGADSGGFTHNAYGVKIGDVIATGGANNYAYPIYSTVNESSYLAGGLGIGMTAASNFKPHSSAAFEINSTSQGMLPPRMTFNLMQAIPFPAEGLMVYCTDCLPVKGLRVFDGAGWTNPSGTAAPAATFTFTGNYYQSNNFTPGNLNSSHQLSFEVNVTQSGTINFSSTTVNGYSFSGIRQVSSNGLQWISLLATGTLNTYNSSGDSFTLNGVGTTSPTTSVTITHNALGSSLTSHFNGITNEVSTNNLLATYTTGEIFSNNTLCSTAPISKSPCVGTSLTVGSNTYPIANINGQCWMTQNLKELPNGVAINPTNWLNTAAPNTSSYGFYNTTTPNGTAGWATTEPLAGDGLLYQWTAAMNGESRERAQGVCPVGWHIPSDCEFMYLEHGLGMSLSEQIKTGQRSNTNDSQGTPGYKLRSEGAGQTNASGFSGLLRGYRFGGGGTFIGRNGISIFWTSTSPNSNSAFVHNIINGFRGTERFPNYKGDAWSVRCLKD